MVHVWSCAASQVEEEGWDVDSGDEEHSKGCDDEVVEVEESGSNGSVNVLPF